MALMDEIIPTRCNEPEHTMNSQQESLLLTQAEKTTIATSYKDACCRQAAGQA